LDYNKHVRLEFGVYVQTHEEHTNDIQPWTIGAICLGPSGNEQGGHFFMSLVTGKRLLRDHWTALPMPHDAIVTVGTMGRQQGMPKTLTFADRHGSEIRDDDDEVNNDHDSAYDPDDASTSSDEDSGSSASESDDDDDGDDGNSVPAQPLLGLTAGVDNDGTNDNDDEDDENSDSGSDDSDSDDDSNGDNDDDVADVPADEEELREPGINVLDVLLSAPVPTRQPTPVPEPAPPTLQQSAGVGGVTAGVGTDVAGVNTGVGDDCERVFHDTMGEHNRMNQQLMDEQYGPHGHDINLRA
jgi:hypothetical protein